MKTYLFLVIHIPVIFAGHDGFCDKNFFYHPIHAYGYDITCEKLDNQTLSELSTANAYNEIQLTIKSSSLQSVKWQISSNLPKLREIRIVNSTIIDSNLFDNLNNLRLLSITHSTINNNSYVGIDGLLNLNKLVLNNNSLSHLNFNRAIYSLEYLNLDNNKFEKVDDISPCTYPNLKQLSLKHNKLFDVSNTTCLRNLLGLYLDYNNIDHINLEMPKVNTLGLRFNKLKSFKNPIGKMTQLEHLDLEGNNLNFVQTDNFKELINLKYLNLRRNKLSALPDKIFLHNPKLQHLYLDNNRLAKVDLNTSSITELLMSNNQIKSIDFIIKLKSLRRLDISLNKISEVPNKVFDNFTSLIFLNLSFNGIHDHLYQESFYGLENLLGLDISHTNTKQFLSSKYLCNLKNLNISNNNLSNFTGFDDLHCLETLNVSYNHLNDVKVTSMVNLKHLRIIDLEGNHLKNIEYVQILSKLPSLQVINIRNNSLPCEFLDEMIGYFKNNSVNFTVDSKLNYDKENVAGIYCKQQEYLNNTERLRSKQEAKYDNATRYNVFAILISLTAVFGVLLTVLFGFRLHFKRKSYVSDTVQLLDR